MYKVGLEFRKNGQKIQILEKKENIRKGEFKDNEEIYGIDLSRLSHLEADICSNCPNLMWVRLSPALTHIPRGAFEKCRNLEYVEIPKMLLCIGERAFYFCSFKEFRLPPRLKTIEDSAFLNCKELLRVVLPSGLETIGKRAFSGCNSLSEAIFDGSPLHIGEKAFNKNCTLVCERGNSAGHYALENGNPITYRNRTKGQGTA